MTVMTGKLISIGGEPFGGPDHAVNIYSRVTRTSLNGDAVILQLIDRIEMPGQEHGGDGSFTTTEMDPGPIRVELEGSSRHGEGWDITLPDPEEGGAPWSLGELIDLQIDWDPVVVGRAEAAAREAGRQAGVATEHADVASAQREHIDTVVYDVMTDAAGMVRGEVRDDADRAEAQAGVATEQAGLSGQHREGAEAAADSAHAAAGAAAEDTTALIRDEMDDKVSEATSAAGASEASEAAAAGAAATAAEARDEAVQAEGTIRDEHLPAVEQARADASQDRQAVAQDRQVVESIVEDVETHRDEIIAAAEHVGSAAQVEQWHDGAVAAAGVAQGAVVEARQEADRAEAATDGKADLVEGRVPTSQIPAVALTKPHSVSSVEEMLALDVQEGDVAVITKGDGRGTFMLGDGPASSLGSWVELAASAEVPVQSVNGQTGTVVLGPADVGAAPEVHTHRWETIKERPQSFPPEGHRHGWGELDDVPDTFPPVGHRHEAEQIDGLDPAIRALIREASSTHLWDGVAPWVAPWWAGPNDSVINLDTGEIHSVVEEEDE